MDTKKAQEYFEAKMNFTTGPMELNSLLKNGEKINVIDVRAAEDYAKGHIPSAKNLPKANWDKTDSLSKDKTNIIYCYSQVCHLAANAASQFAKKGYPVMEMEGGFKAWTDHKLDIAK